MLTTAHRITVRRRRSRRPPAASRGSNGPRAWTRALGRAPALNMLAAAILLAALLMAANAAYQVARKPSELLFPVSGALAKSPVATWRSYAPLFRRYSTRVITAPFLAALAQTEAAGDPVARTYWRWSWRANPLDIYRPASTSVGMYQMTDGTFAEARRLCIREHQVAQSSCWFNSAYFRVIPSHAVELTSAYLDAHVSAILARHGLEDAAVGDRQHLAAAIHLCGAGAADLYARQGFRFHRGQRCADHDPRDYLARVDALQALFTRLAAAGE